MSIRLGSQLACGRLARGRVRLARTSSTSPPPAEDALLNTNTDSRKNTPLISTTTWGNAGHGTVLFETGHLHMLNHRSVSDGITGITVWGMVTDNWPDETNQWYGPTIRNGALHATSDLPFKTPCGMGGPWDDTLFVSNMQFHGKFKGGFCPCFSCLSEEGGYEIRTSKLGWHEDAGTHPPQGNSNREP